MRLLPNIQFGTTGYPEPTARRARAVNMTAWISAPVAAGFALLQLFAPYPGLWKTGLVNGLAALLLVAVPLFHRIGPSAAPLAFTMVAYATIFFDCYLLGIGTGMQFYYLGIAALMIFFLGPTRFVLSAALASLAGLLIIVLEMFVPRNTGLQPESVMFASFAVTVGASCLIVFTIVSYGVREVERENARSESLLVNILPAAIAARLKTGAESIIADRYDEASILFADMEGFTARTSDTAPEDLVRFLNRVFSNFDHLVERHRLEKIKTTGDAYMVVSGVPLPRRDHAQALAQLALDLRDAVTGLIDLEGRAVPIRFGIACGPVVAGVVGTRRFFYDVWGDAVNVASRMESTGQPGKIQVSHDIYERLKGEFILESRGVIPVKGKGEMHTWFLIGRDAPAPNGR